ncbi:MAG: 7-carboxy-7-deazaguanine synthase [Ignavibacteriales bacterium]|nr:7-carboxy-7-deazaguanine synthase [Ignavibacteriales bacterium]
MGYSVKESYYTLQGEGAHTGRAAVFCRFAGCNLWSGREEDRGSAICNFCDTEFFGVDGPGGGHFDDARDLAKAVRAKWPEDTPTIARPFLVCTGGEPLLQLDDGLVKAFHAEGFEVAVETNGTRTPPAGVDWICVSPKAGAELLLKSGNELKLVFPQPGAEPELFDALRFDHFYLQPMDGPEREENTELARNYCLAHPQWKISLQTHKILGIP